METIFNTQKRPCAYTIPAWIVATVIIATFFDVASLPLGQGIGWGFFILAYLGGMFRLQFFIAKQTSPDTAVAFMKGFAFAVLAGCLPLLAPQFGLYTPNTDPSPLLLWSVIFCGVGMTIAILVIEASLWLIASWVGYNLIFLNLFRLIF